MSTGDVPLADDQITLRKSLHVIAHGIDDADKLVAEEDALAEKDALAKKDTAESNASTVSIGSKGQTAAAEVNARKSEVPAEVQPLVADPSQLIDAMDKVDQERAARQQLHPARALEDLDKVRKLQQQAVMPAAQGNSPNASRPSK
jgi:hypothetical protein